MNRLRRPNRHAVFGVSLVHFAMASALVTGGALAGVAAFSSPASATTYNVTTSTETGAGSLSAAITSYNSDTSGSDTITFSSGLDIVLSAPLPAIDNTNGVPLTINGGGGTVDGNDTYRVFLIDTGAVTVTNLTIEDGFVDGDGGGILNEGTLTATDDTFDGNTALADGGAIANEVDLGGPEQPASYPLEESTPTATLADDLFEYNVGDLGGAIYSNEGLSATNDTFWENTATEDDAPQGGAIYNDDSLTVTNATFVYNSSDVDEGDAIFDDTGATTTLTNSLIAYDGGDGSYCDGPGFTDGGYNITDEFTNSCNFGSTSTYDANDTGTNSIFGTSGPTLANNGGPTETVAIPPTSSDSDVSVAAYFAKTNCPTADQRGNSRPSTDCSTGAYQVPFNSVGSPPGSPTVLTATNEGNEIVLSWQASSGATCYNIYRFTSTTTATLIATICPSGSSSAVRSANARSASTASSVSASDPTYTDTTAACGVNYSYYVTATNSIGQSGPSNTASSSVPCSTGTPGASQGYWLAGSDGGIFSFGNVSYHGSVPGDGIHVNNVVGMAPTHDSGGYWLAGSDGGVFTFGDATYHGSVPGDGIHINNVRGIAPTADGGGYYMVGTDGGVFTFGDALYHGSVPGDGIHVNNIIGIIPTADGGGYWIVGSDGGVFTFGDATYHGSVPGDGIHINNVVGLAPTSDGAGYWMTGTDGGVFTFGDATYHGSVPGDGIHVSNVRGIFATPDGAGYWLFGTDGGIFTFGDANYEGSVPGDGIHVSNVLAGAT